LGPEEKLLTAKFAKKFQICGEEYVGFQDL